MLTRVRAIGTAVAVILPVIGLTAGTQSAAASSVARRVITKGATIRYTAPASATDSPSKGEIPAPDLENRGANGPSKGAAPSGAAPATSARAIAHAGSVAAARLNVSFDGLYHRQQRLANGGNQFSVEPPDQGMCVSKTRILEAVNDVLRVYTKGGTPDSGVVDLNSFYGYAPAINRTTHIHGPFVTDPSCIYDAATSRWFLTVLTLETDPNSGAFTGQNHLDIAVSTSNSPTGTWNIYRLAVQDDGTQGTPTGHCSLSGGAKRGPCIGDYPHIGADTNGFYVTTNEYSFFGPEFHGAQIYAFNKHDLATGANNIYVLQWDTHMMDNGNSGFTVWPAQSPDKYHEAAPSKHGSEYFLSSNAADEAHGDGSAPGPRRSTQLLVWALTTTDTLLTNGGAVPDLSVTPVTVPLYKTPPPSNQKSGPTPLKDCLNDTTCAPNILGNADPFAESLSPLDSNDTRMQQVTFANGLLWGALDTGLIVGGAEMAGIEWFTIHPSVSPASVLSASLSNSGYLGVAGNNLTYPAIGVTKAGNAAMGFTLVGNDNFPSAAYVTLSSATGTGTVQVAGVGAGPEDGFSGYKAFGNPPRPRWGDYGAAASDGNSIWLASEYIGQTCTLAEYTSSPFGSCGGTRSSLANWDTRISEVVVQ